MANRVIELLRSLCKERFALISDGDIDVIFGASLVSTKLNELNCNNSIESISFY